MKLAFVDETGLEEAFDNIEQIAAACEEQLADDFSRVWQDAPIPVKAYASLDEVPHDWDIVGFFQTSDDPGAAGYHAVTPDGRPYAKVFVADTLAAGLGWLGENGVGVTASHEALEGRKDPGANMWAESRRGFLRAFEMGDYVESRCYKKNGVYVSDFLTAQFFEPGSKGPYDFMDTVEDPDADPGPGDYEIRMDTRGQAYPVFGAEFPESKMRAKAFHASRTARRLKLGSYGRGDHRLQGIPDEHKMAFRKMLSLAWELRGV